MKRRSRFFLLVLIAGAILSAVVPSRVRSQSKSIATDRLVQMSEVVARGKVRDMRSEWDESRSRIRTRVTISVDEYLKGGGGGTMEVIVPGGEVGSAGEVYSHVARFSKDENVVVFAKKDNSGRYRVSSGSQGKFSVTKDEKTGKSIVSHYWTLDDFKEEIDKVLKDQGRK